MARHNPENARYSPSGLYHADQSAGTMRPRARIPLNLGPATAGLARYYVNEIRRAAELGLARLEALHAETELGMRLDDLGHHFEEVIAGCQRAINPPEEEEDDEPEEPTIVYEEGGES